MKGINIFNKRTGIEFKPLSNTFIMNIGKPNIISNIFGTCIYKMSDIINININDTKINPITVSIEIPNII